MENEILSPPGIRFGQYCTCMANISLCAIYPGQSRWTIARNFGVLHWPYQLSSAAVLTEIWLYLAMPQYTKMAPGHGDEVLHGMFSQPISSGELAKLILARNEVYQAARSGWISCQCFATVRYCALPCDMPSSFPPCPMVVINQFHDHDQQVCSYYQLNGQGMDGKDLYKLIFLTRFVGQL